MSVWEAIDFPEIVSIPFDLSVHMMSNNFIFHSLSMELPLPSDTKFEGLLS